jgi:hypothetical protein
MKEERIPMGQKKLHRWHLMKMAEVGKIILKEASEKMGVSYRQGKWIWSVSGEGRRLSVHTKDLFVALRNGEEDALY